MPDSISIAAPILDTDTASDPAAATVERILAEGPIGMQAAARLIGTMRAGVKTHPSTPARWCNTGVKLPDGRTLRLEHIRTAGKIATSRAAIIRFLAAQQLPQDESNQQAAPRSPAARTRSNAKASEELAAMGVK